MLGIDAAELSSQRTPWNKGRLIGQKRPLKPNEVWAIRVRLQLEERRRDLAPFNLALDSKLRGCDLVKLQVNDVCISGRVRDRPTAIQRKTCRPVQFEITEQTRAAIRDWVANSVSGTDSTSSRAAFMTSRTSRHDNTLGSSTVGWESAGLDSSAYGTHSIRRTKVAQIYKKTGNLRRFSSCSGTQSSKAPSITCIEVDDALSISGQVELKSNPDQWPCLSEGRCVSEPALPLHRRNRYAGRESVRQSVGGMRLDPLFRPESIAVIGASEKPTPGRRIIASLERIGFAGRIFPVNPNYPSVLNRPCYASPAELPEAPDIAVFCLGHERVFSAFEAAAKRGMKAAVIYDGGFAEQGAEGRALQARIAAICVEAGIALCGPNCMGILNPHHKSTTYLQELREPAGLAGNVAILSHSGGLCVGLLTDTRRFGFSHIVSSGNEATVSAAAFLEYLLEDPHTAIVGGFIEAIREPERFAAALNRAAALDKPVVMVKVGRHERTRRAITTHTGGDADDPTAASALLRTYGAIEVADIVELAETLAGFQTAQCPAGRRLAVITSSGGLAELILDVAAEIGIELPPLSPSQKAEIEAEIGFVTGDGNPLDAWGSGTFAANLPLALKLFDASPAHDVIAFLRDNFDDQPFDAPETARSYIEMFAAAARRSAKPHYLLTTRPGVMDRALVGVLREHGVATVGGLREGLMAIDRLARNAK